MKFIYKSFGNDKSMCFITFIQKSQNKFAAKYMYLKSNNMKLYYIKIVEIAYFVQNVGNEIDVTGN